MIQLSLQKCLHAIKIILPLNYSTKQTPMVPRSVNQCALVCGTCQVLIMFAPNISLTDIWHLASVFSLAYSAWLYVWDGCGIIFYSLILVCTELDWFIPNTTAQYMIRVIIKTYSGLNVILCCRHLASSYRHTHSELPTGHTVNYPKESINVYLRCSQFPCLSVVQ